MEVLITYGHPVDCRDEKGWPPLLYAHFASHQECVLDPKGTTPLHLAALSGWVKCVEVLITYGHPVDCRDEKGWPPLLYAHFASHQECVLALMKEKPGQVCW